MAQLKKRFIEVEIPVLKKNIELFAKDASSLQNQTIKFDLSRQLRGKSTEAVFTVNVEKEKATATLKSLKLMPYFIKRMLRKRISYVEDSFPAETKESKIIIKPFLITRKKVSRVVRKTLRNSAKNWLIDYAKTKTDKQLFQDIISNILQKSLSLKLKKIYPLSLCEIRILEIKTPLEKTKPKEEISRQEEKTKKEIKKPEKEKKSSAKTTTEQKE